MLLSLLTLALAASASQSPSLPDQALPDLDYLVRIESGPSPALMGELRFRAAAEGPTTVVLDEGWGGTQDIASALAFLEVTDEDGTSLDLTTDEPARWTVECDAGEALVARWGFAANALQADPDPRQHYKPIVNDGLVHFLGTLGLLGVPHLEEPEGEAAPGVEAVRSIRFRWEGVEERGWQAATSFGAGSGPFDVTTPPARFRHALFVAGDVALELRDVHGRDLAVVVAPGDWDFTPEAFADLTVTVVETQRAFMEDWETPWYLVGLVPVGSAQARGFSLGGTGLTNAFATFCQPGASLDPTGPYREQIVLLLAHEMFHEWNGRVIRRADDEEVTLYWFSEGFTEFFERRTALRSGLLTPAQAAADVDQHLVEYATSPARDLGNAHIAEGFWTDPGLQRLPYLRGDLIACYLDRAIRVRTEGAAALDDLMRELAAAGREENARVTATSLHATFARWAGEDAAATVRGWVENGGPIELPLDTFAPCGRLESVEVVPFDVGFDLESSMQLGRVTDLRSGSPADAAGLTEGQVVRGWSVYRGRSDLPVELTVVDPDGTERAVEFLPRGAPGPAQRLVVEGDCAGL